MSREIETLDDVVALLDELDVPGLSIEVRIRHLDRRLSELNSERIAAVGEVLAERRRLVERLREILDEAQSGFEVDLRIRALLLEEAAGGTRG